jgi:soluble lytic murein transglycosylase-like protein
MPFHFSDGENPVDPATNAHRGLSYLKQSLDAAGGDVRLALAGYNGGIGILDRPESAWPYETRRYAEWGSRLYNEAVSRQDSSHTLEEWLSSGGSALCNRASKKLFLGSGQ